MKKMVIFVRNLKILLIEMIILVKKTIKKIPTRSFWGLTEKQKNKLIIFD